MLWLDVLPAELSERVARFVCRDRHNEALLHFAQTGPLQRQAALAAVDYKLGPCPVKHSENIEEWQRMFTGHVRELHFHDNTWQASSSSFVSLMMESQLRRFVIVLRDNCRVAAILQRRKWDDVDVHLFIIDKHPFEDVLQIMRLVRPRFVVFLHHSGDGSYDFLDTEDGRDLEDSLCCALLDVPEGQVLAYEEPSKWVPLLSRLRGRWLLDMTTKVPLNLLESLPKTTEVHISWYGGVQPIDLPDYAVFGTAVTEIDFFPSLRECVLPTHYLVGLAEWFPNLRRLQAGLEAGSETKLPRVLSKLTKLTALSLTWGREFDAADGDRYYRPAAWSIVEGIEQCARLSTVCFSEVELTAQELGSILQHQGAHLQEFRTDLDRGPAPLERALAVAVAAAQYCPALCRLKTKAEKTNAWRERSETWKRRIAAAAGLLEKRCLFLEPNSTRALL